MQLDRAGSSKPGDQHLVALYDPSGKRLGHARLHARLRDHGTTLAAHLPQRLQPEPTGSKQRHNIKRVPGDSHRCPRKGRVGSKKLHVHYHVDSPPPLHRSGNCRGHSRAASKSRQRNCRNCSRERPVTGPEERGQEQASWLASGGKANSLSAPSTPWHRQEGCANEDHNPQRDEAGINQSAPPVNPCTAHHLNHHPAVVCDSQTRGSAPEQNTQGLHGTHNCTVCGSGHHFKTPATQDITAVACEMMTLVSMRTAMSEVLGNLVHKWRDVMPSSLDLPGMAGEAGAQDKAPQKGACMQAGQPASEWTIPASVAAPNQAHERAVEPQAGEDADAAAQLDPPKEMLLTHQPSQLSPTPTQDKDVLDRDIEAPAAVSSMCGGAPNTTGKKTSSERHKRREVKAAQNADPGRDDSMSGPFQVTFAAGVRQNSEKRSKKRSSRHSRSSNKQRADKKMATAATIPEQTSAADPIDQQQDESIATQEVHSSTFGWTESAISVATDAAAGCAAVAAGQPGAVLQQSISNAPAIKNVSIEDRQEVGNGVVGRTARELSEQSAQPVQSQGTRSESAWPLSDDDTFAVPDGSSRNGAGQVKADVGESAAMPVDSDDAIASSKHDTVLSSQGSDVKSSRESKSKDGGNKAKLGRKGKENTSERSQAMESVRSTEASTTYSSLYKSGKSFESTSPESAHTVPDLCVPAHTQEPVWKHSSSMESVPISEDTPLVEAASRAQSKAASSVLSKQRSAISVSSMLGSLISDGTVSLNGSIQSKAQNSGASENSNSFVSTSSISDGYSSASQSSSCCSKASTSIKSESARDYANSGSPASTGGLEEVSHSHRSRQRSGATSAAHTVKSSRSNTYTSGYTRTTENTSPTSVTDVADLAAAPTSAVDSTMHLDSSLHSDRSATEHRYQSEDESYTQNSSQTSSGGESRASDLQPASAAFNGWHHPSGQLPYAQHMPQFQQMSQLQQMQYMHQTQDAEVWNTPQEWNSRMHMHGQDGMAMHPDQADAYSDVDTRTRSGPEQSVRMSEIDRSLAGTTMRSGIDSSSSDYSMASDEGSSESGASLEP